MAEKKENTKAMPEVVYTVEEYAENPKILSEQHLRKLVLEKQHRVQQRNL